MRRKLSAGLVRNWEADAYDRPVVAMVTVWRLSFGFSFRWPYLEVYLGWWGVGIYWGRV